MPDGPVVVDNTPLVAFWGLGRLTCSSPSSARSWGRLVESAIGAHSANAILTEVAQPSYRRLCGHEVDFVVKARRLLTAIEVRSGAAREAQPRMAAFAATLWPARRLFIGGDGNPLGKFLSDPEETLVRGWPHGRRILRYPRRALARLEP